RVRPPASPRLANARTTERALLWQAYRGRSSTLPPLGRGSNSLSVPWTFLQCGSRSLGPIWQHRVPELGLPHQVELEDGVPDDVVLSGGENVPLPRLGALHRRSQWRRVDSVAPERAPFAATR